MSKRAEEAARKAYPSHVEIITDIVGKQGDLHEFAREVYQEGYEQAEKDLGWHSVKESLPPIDEDVIVLADRLNLGALFAIAIGHIVDKEKVVDYNGWNIPGVRYWMPMPKIPDEK